MSADGSAGTVVVVAAGRSPTARGRARTALRAPAVAAQDVGVRAVAGLTPALLADDQELPDLVVLVSDDPDCEAASGGCVAGCGAACPLGALLATARAVVTAGVPAVVLWPGVTAQTAAALLLAGASRVVDVPLAAPALGRLLRTAAARGVPPGAAPPAVPAPRAARAPAGRVVPRLLVLGASTGGPAALQQLLRRFPARVGLPILVVQHLADGFVSGLAQHLDAAGPLPVAVATDGMQLRPDTVTVAPTGCDSVLTAGLRLRCRPVPAGRHHVPGIDVALQSAVVALDGAVAAALLTGMGRDGAAGLLAVRRAGGLTWAQDEASCSVYGMPAAALELGAVPRTHALADLPDLILAELGVLLPRRTRPTPREQHRWTTSQPG